IKIEFIVGIDGNCVGQSLNINEHIFFWKNKKFCEQPVPEKRRRREGENALVTAKSNRFNDIFTEINGCGISFRCCEHYILALIQQHLVERVDVLQLAFKIKTKPVGAKFMKIDIVVEGLQT